MSTIYLPVATPEMVEMATKLNTGRTGKGKTGYNIIQCTDSGAAKWARRQQHNKRLLLNVPATEKLYVLIHGIEDQHDQPVGLVGVRRGAEAVQSHGVTTWVGGKRRTYTPLTLAKHLNSEALTKQIVDLRLFACYSGVPSGKLPQNVSFAEALKTEMRGLGYNSVQVTGYFGALGDGYLHASMGGNNAAHKQGMTANPASFGKLSVAKYKTVLINNEEHIASANKQVW
jgi:hypothetical protein